MSHTKTNEQTSLTLNAEQLSKALGISRAGAYELMHSRGFPTLRIGKRMMVSREQLAKWVEARSGETWNR